ncbi:MAG: anthranilate phosphoribosyltransferase, partial [Crocinitomicaceae bacterium]|nr:anthranilate phosphoribosyltransferase [Crocinitomicaceae bacterium]
ASFLTVFMMRNISIPEFKGFREAMLALAVPVDFSEYNSIDLCGTGGDGKDTFNISTLTSFVVAGAGIPVTKHGNYGVSSICGSSNVLEQLGVRFTSDEQVLKQQLETAGICFLHAPLFHPAMKAVAPIRKELGVKTFFNLLGPLTNPVQPKNQMVGVFNLEVARMYQYFLQEAGSNYAIIHALDGFDEISLTDKHKEITSNGEAIKGAKDFGFQKVNYKDLAGGNSVNEAAQIFLNVLEGKGTESQEKVVLANASTAIKLVTKKEPDECMNLAVDSLLSGKAEKALEFLIRN